MSFLVFPTALPRASNSAYGHYSYNGYYMLPRGIFTVITIPMMNNYHYSIPHQQTILSDAAYGHVFHYCSSHHNPKNVMIPTSTHLSDDDDDDNDGGGITRADQE